MATIHLSDIELSLIIGTKDEERRQPQTVTLNIWFDYNSSQAADTDDLTYAVDYEHILNKVISGCEKKQYFLIEKLAQYVMDILFQETRIQQATVKIDKPNALANAKAVSITLDQERN